MMWEGQLREDFGEGLVDRERFPPHRTPSRIPDTAKWYQDSCAFGWGGHVGEEQQVRRGFSNLLI